MEEFEALPPTNKRKLYNNGLPRAKRSKNKAGPGPPKESKGAPPDIKKKPSRYDSSLGLLTKKFNSMIKNAENGIMDLNTAAEALNVQKRRVYDITNVLEGVGMIEKKGKNHIQWKGSFATSHIQQKQKVEEIQYDIKQLADEDGKLDHYIQFMHDNLRKQLQHYQKHAYTTYSDMVALPCFKDQTIIAVKAPPQSSLEVPDPDEGLEDGRRRYQIFLKSSGGEMDVLLINAEERTAPDQPEQTNAQPQFSEQFLTPDNVPASAAAAVNAAALAATTARKKKPSLSLTPAVDATTKTSGPDSVMKLSPLIVKDDLDSWNYMNETDAGVTELFEGFAGDQELFDGNNNLPFSVLKALSPMHIQGNSFFGNAQSNNAESPIASST